MQLHVARVHDGDHAVEPQVFFELVVHEEGLDHRRGIREAGGLDEDAIKAVAALEQVSEDADEIASDGAAQAPVVHLEHFFIAAEHERLIDADLAKLILDHRDALTVIFGQDAIEQGGFSRSEKTSQNGDRDAGISRA